MHNAQNNDLKLFFFIIQTAMTKAFKIRVGNLVTKFFAHTNVVFGFLDTAGAITVFPL